MNIKQRLDLIKQVGEEVITEEELKTLLETKKHPIAYDGFEPSGDMHIAQGILRASLCLIFIIPIIFIDI